MEDEEESITDSNNINSDVFIHAYSSQIENLDAIFTSDNLDRSNEPVNAINNLKINNARYELKTTTTSDAQGNLTSDLDTVTHTSNGPDTVTHTSNVVSNKKLLRFRTIGEFHV